MDPTATGDAALKCVSSGQLVPGTGLWSPYLPPSSSTWQSSPPLILRCPDHRADLRHDCIFLEHTSVHPTTYLTKHPQSNV